MRAKRSSGALQPAAAEPAVPPSKRFSLTNSDLWKATAASRATAYAEAGLKHPWSDVQWFTHESSRIQTFNAVFDADGTGFPRQSESLELVNHDLYLPNGKMGTGTGGELPTFRRKPEEKLGLKTVKLEDEYEPTHVKGDQRFKQFTDFLVKAGRPTSAEGTEEAHPLPRRVITAGHSNWFKLYMRYLTTVYSLDEASCDIFAKRKLKNQAMASRTHSFPLLGVCV